MFKVPPRAYL